MRVGVIVCFLMDHAKNIPSTEEKISRGTKRVAKALTANSYPAKFIHNSRQPNKQRGMNDTDQRDMVILPYAERITKGLRGFNINAFISLFAHPQTYLKGKP